METKNKKSKPAVKDTEDGPLQVDEIIDRISELPQDEQTEILDAFSDKEQRCPPPSRWLSGYVEGNPPRNTLAFFHKLDQCDQDYVRRSYKARGVQLPPEMQ